MREGEEGRGKEGERLGERQWGQVIRRVILEWGGYIFYIIPINAYPAYINASLMQKRRRIYITIQDVWGIWRK